MTSPPPPPPPLLTPQDNGGHEEIGSDGLPADAEEPMLSLVASVGLLTVITLVVAVASE